MPTLSAIHTAPAACVRHESLKACVMKASRPYSSSRTLSAIHTAPAACNSGHILIQYMHQA